MYDHRPLVLIDGEHKFISLVHPRELSEWTKRLDCSEAELRNAIQAIGYSAAEVRLYLARRRR